MRGLSYWRTAGNVIVYSTEAAVWLDGFLKVLCYRADTEGAWGWLKVRNLAPIVFEGEY